MKSVAELTTDWMEGRCAEVDAKLEVLREQELKTSAVLQQEFMNRLEVSIIYHDAALEGVVLSYSEIKAAIDKNIISDVSLIPSYQEIKDFKTALEWIHEYATNRKRPINFDTIRKLYSLITPEEVAKGLPYRRENPLHRTYYHEIAMPDKINYRMRKLGSWMEEDATKRLHPVERAALFHFKLMSVFPWMKNTGRLARLLSNLVLLREGYLPTVIHSIDRQRYYEALRVERGDLTLLYLEALSTTIDTAMKFYDEAARLAAMRIAS